MIYANTPGCDRTLNSAVVLVTLGLAASPAF